MNLNIQEVAYHRNGICGEGFYAVRFQWAIEDVGEVKNWLAILFDGPGQCAVTCLDMIAECGVRFAGGNSWRGDHFEDALRKAIKETPSSGGVRVGPFCIPTDLEKAKPWSNDDTLLLSGIVLGTLLRLTHDELIRAAASPGLFPVHARQIEALARLRAELFQTTERDPPYVAPDLEGK